MEYIITAHNLTRIYTLGNTETHALSSATVTIRRGEFISIVGKSGAGKSTLLYQLSLLDRPSSGSLHVYNTDVLALSEPERTEFRLAHLGYVFQDYALVPELTAEENVALPLLMRKIPYETARIKAQTVLKRLGLEHRYAHRSNRLSGGEQQRVSVARAIVHDPQILFADEPTANLDTSTSEELLAYLHELHTQGQTIIMVTHEKEYAAQADRIIEMRDGKIVS